MKWRRRSAPTGVLEAPQPVVFAVTEPVTRETAAGLASRVDRLAANAPVVIDLTGIPSFDSDGAAVLVGLQESYGEERLTIVGLRQATARLVGSDDVQPDAGTPPAAATWVVRRLRAIAVVQTDDDRPATPDGLEAAVTSALDEQVGIVVVDLRNAALTRSGLQAIAFASSQAAVRGQELLVVNVDDDTAEQLRHTGLSATTYLAPAPPPES